MSGSTPKRSRLIFHPSAEEHHCCFLGTDSPTPHASQNKETTGTLASYTLSNRSRWFSTGTHVDFIRVGLSPQTIPSHDLPHMWSSAVAIGCSLWLAKHVLFNNVKCVIGALHWGWLSIYSCVMLTWYVLPIGLLFHLWHDWGAGQVTELGRLLKFYLF